VALADKLDTLVGFWAIDEKPTGSKDPFALRRAALGVIKIILARGEAFRLSQGFLRAGELLDKQKRGALSQSNPLYPGDTSVGLELFFADRLKVHLKDEGIRHDVIDAVFALGDDDLVRVTNKSRALQAFLDTDDGAALLAGYRRAANILSAEEKKGFDLGAAVAEMLGAHPTPTLPSRGGSDAGPAALTGTATESTGAPNSPPSPSGEGRGGGITPDEQTALLIAISKTATAPEERTLISEIQAAEAVAGKALGEEDFSGAMSALARLRGPVDAFFEAVVVNDKDDIVRRNRLVLLSRIRAAADAVADFSRLEG
jgi:glycyl-tRNA synthetase beta chain